MSDIETGMRGWLKFPSVYRLFNSLIGANVSRLQIVRTYVRPNEGDKILDIGCEPADILALLPPVEYVGFDANLRYIRQAKKRYSNQGIFFCETVDQANLPSKYKNYFDIVLAFGILHHLNDSEALKLLQVSYEALHLGGRLITVDGVFTTKQSPCAKWIIASDRGQFVRTRDGYLTLIEQVFENFDIHIHDDLLRIPYTHIIIQCQKI